jgi:transposase
MFRLKIRTLKRQTFRPEKEKEEGGKEKEKEGERNRKGRERNRKRKRDHNHNPNPNSTIVVPSVARYRFIPGSEWRFVLAIAQWTTNTVYLSLAKVLIVLMRSKGSGQELN